MGVFKKGNVWWIDYYVQGRRKREKVGPNKRLAETVLQKRKVEIAEGKYLDKKKEVNSTFKELRDFYLRYSKGHKKSYVRDVNSFDRLDEFFGKWKVSQITPSMIDDYKVHRQQTISHTGKKVSPATINRELSAFKHAFNLALREGLCDYNPVSRVKMLRENNERDRVLSKDEYGRLLSVSPQPLRSVLIIAYNSAMRRGEILSLKWSQVDLKNGFIQLQREDTKTGEEREIPLNSALYEVFSKDVLRNLHSEYVFCKADGTPFKDMRTSFERVCKEADIQGFVFHDFRHTAITNWRRAGVDMLTIMKMSGHRDVRMFKRYNTISRDDLKKASGQVEGYLSNEMDTYMDTKASAANPTIRK